MGRQVVEAYPSSRALFDRAEVVVGWSVGQLCWQGPMEELTRTVYCQPAIYVTSLAILAALEEECQRCGVPLQPVAAAGLSLGEYTALAAAGAFSFEDGLRLVCVRAEAMEEASQRQAGTMASVLGLDVEVLKAICIQTGAEIANLNAPDQVVLSGAKTAMERALVLAKERGAKRVVPLAVGGAFHSRLMEPASRRLEEALKTVSIHPPRFPVASNVTGTYFQEVDSIRRGLVEQLTHPVQWVGCMERLCRDGIDLFLEIGPGTVLKGLLRKFASQMECHSVEKVEEVRQVVRLLHERSTDGLASGRACH